ncbi:hypothetical protein CN378_17105 [Bacillus sp. AFS015802]|nr:hypothetical protein CN378_17105 [Bacillus sp. AFS015802]
MVDLTYDLEPLAAGAGHQKSGRGSHWGDKHKTRNPERRSLPFWVPWLMTSSPKPPELDIAEKRMQPMSNFLYHKKTKKVYIEVSPFYKPGYTKNVRTNFFKKGLQKTKKRALQKVGS